MRSLNFIVDHLLRSVNTPRKKLLEQNQDFVESFTGKANRCFKREHVPPFPSPFFHVPEQIWDVPASSKTPIGPEIVAATSCSLLLIDLDDWNSFRTAKRWHSLIMEGEICCEACCCPSVFINSVQSALALNMTTLSVQCAATTSFLFWVQVVFFV